MAAAPYLMWAGMAGFALLVALLPWKLPRWAGSTLFVWFYVVPILDIVMHAAQWMIGMHNDWTAAIGPPNALTAPFFGGLCLASFPVSYLVHRGLYKQQALTIPSYLLVSGLAAGMLLSGALAVEVASAAEPAATPAAAAKAKAGWQELEPGLDLLEWRTKHASAFGDSTVRALRIDPARFSFRLVNASATGGTNRSAREWSQHASLVAAINASMFAPDHSSSVGLMKTGKHVNNARLSKDNAVFAFDPRAEGLPAVRMIDRACDDFKTLRLQYGSLAQNIRMISCKGKNVWAKQPRKWSIAAVGVDDQGRVLFLHSRSPYTVHDFIDELLASSLHIQRAMYVEGGPEAQLYVKSGDFEREWLGSYETGFYESDDNKDAWPIPNVIGIVRK